MEEDKIYAREIAPFLNLDNEKAKRIWYYACAEMLNNVIEHAQGQKLTVLIERNYLFSKVIIVDDGIGIFQNLVHTLETRGWYKPDLEDAIVELYKGKLTSSPDSHSGEGIFFTSKMLDQFFVWSDALSMKCRSIEPTELVQSHLLAYASKFNHVGTLVMMQLENATDRDLSEVFSLYANMEEGFYKTYIPVKEACITGEPVARSQARRICHRLEEFQEVVFDFSNVEFMGQGFADEVFRVFADAHPDMKLMPENMNADVEMMLHHVINNKKNSNSKTSS